MAFLLAVLAGNLHGQSSPVPIGRQVAIPRHLQDGEEFQVTIQDLLRYGQRLFEAHFTIEEGTGRPLTKGTALRFRTLPTR
ncbi:MAG TPA: hypothetical protein VHU83_03205 [Bryobacteraceae bacterium]|nr:hypothetical protein [Bryobacteraceae bacterium]